jgi:hypothetical protein
MSESFRRFNFIPFTPMPPIPVPMIAIDRATGQVVLTMQSGWDGSSWSMVCGPIGDFWNALAEASVKYYSAVGRELTVRVDVTRDREGDALVVALARLDGLAQRASEALGETVAQSNKAEDKPAPRDLVTHRGLTGCLTACVDEGLISGRVLGIDGEPVTFQGETVADAVRAFRYAVDIYLGERDRRASPS